MPDDTSRSSPQRTRLDAAALLALWLAGAGALTALSLHEIGTYGLVDSPDSVFDPAVADVALAAIPPGLVVGATIGRTAPWRIVALLTATASVPLQGGLAGFFVVLRFPGDDGPVSTVALLDVVVVHAGSLVVHLAAVLGVLAFRRRT